LNGSIPDSVQIGPRAFLMARWGKVSHQRPGARHKTNRAATMGDAHRAALLLWWERESMGLTVIHAHGRRVARIEWGGLWALQITEPDGSSRIIHSQGLL
jgi:hypothetical protein